jgi:hypothetical protein
MKRMLLSLGLGAILATSAAAQTTPRNDQPQQPQDRRDLQQERRDDRRNDQQDRRDDRRNDQQNQNRRDNTQTQDRRDNVQQDRRDNVQQDRRDNVQQDRRDNTQPRDRRDNVQTERRDNVQTQERRDGQTQERRDTAGTDARTLSGRVVRTGNGQFIVQTRDNRQVTVYTNPQTRYLQNNRAVQYSDLRVGSNVNFGYATEGDRYIANNVTLLPAEQAVEEVPAQPAQGTVVEGQIVRVIGQDQVVIRTSDGKEVIVYVTPQTTYQLNTPQAATFTDLRVGTPIGVNYDTRDNRFMARRVFAPRAGGVRNR